MQLVDAWKTVGPRELPELTRGLNDRSREPLWRPKIVHIFSVIVCERDPGSLPIAGIGRLAAWLRRDVDRDAAPESIPLLLDGLATRATSPLNQRSAAADLGYTYDSLSLRLAKLVRNFGAVWCPQRDDRGRTVRGSQAKLYLSDPVLGWLPSRLHPACGEPAMTMLTETTIGMHLARAIDGIDEGRLVVNDTIGYARTGAGNKIDLLPIPISSAAGAARTVPIEGKWVDDLWRSDARTIEAKYGKGVLATKSILNTDHPTWAIPAPFLALLLL